MQVSESIVFKHKSLAEQQERSRRSVFVGNISYDVGEDTIKQIFSQVGQVMHFKMVFDRETGKPKGYGFIEFPDVATAESAIRNLNGYELNGRTLRVDSAAGGERTNEEMNHLQQVLGGQQEESPYGPEPESGKAPEAVSRSVASLPPERMFELMKQMKDLVRTNPTEAKSMLVQNPQLSYALLQAQVVMRVIDPQVAILMLHKDTPVQVAPFHHAGGAAFNVPPPVSGAPTTGTFGLPATSTVPPPGYPHPPPPATSQPQRQQQELSAEDQANAQLLMQVMQLTDAEIAELPPSDREKIIELRNQLRHH